MKTLWHAGTGLLIAALCVYMASAAEPAANRQVQLEDLGRALFFDVNLSRDRTQSCATSTSAAI